MVAIPWVLPKLKWDRGTVHFYQENRNLAEEVGQALQEAWQVAEQWGVNLGRFRVALVVPEAEGEEFGGIEVEISFLSFLLAGGIPVIPILTDSGLQSLAEADLETLTVVYWAMPHEATELLVRRFYYDPAMRWVGDGLADYIGYVITGRLAPEAQQWMLERRLRPIQSLLEKGFKSYDLTKEFLVSGTEEEPSKELVGKPQGSPHPGYSVALAFFLQIAQEHGEEVIKTFWDRLSKQRQPSAQEAARLLSELTGEEIWSKLQRMDLQEVLKTLEEAAQLSAIP
jgi:hypothetical protein